MTLLYNQSETPTFVNKNEKKQKHISSVGSGFCIGSVSVCGFCRHDGWRSRDDSGSHGQRRRQSGRSGDQRWWRAHGDDLGSDRQHRQDRACHQRQDCDRFVARLLHRESRQDSQTGDHQMTACHISLHSLAFLILKIEIIHNWKDWNHCNRGYRPASRSASQHNDVDFKP